MRRATPVGIIAAALMAAAPAYGSSEAPSGPSEPQQMIGTPLTCNQYGCTEDGTMPKPPREAHRKFKRVHYGHALTIGWRK